MVSQARRIVSGCEGLAIDPGRRVGNPVGLPAGEGMCVVDPLAWPDAPGVSYSRGCGPPVLPPGASEPFGTRLRQFIGTVGWLG